MNVRRIRSLLGVIVLAAMAACLTADSPTSTPAPNASLLGDVLETTTGTLETTTATVSRILSPFACTTRGYGTVTQTVGSAGGLIRIGPHSLAIPPGALAAPVTITATAPAGSALRVDFEPEGLRFDRATVLTISYAECATDPLLPRVVYVDDLLTLLEVLPTLNITSSDVVTAKVRHFSGYMVWE